MYAGPKELRRLAAFDANGKSLEELVFYNYGWVRMLRPDIWLLRPLQWLYGVTHNYGVAIIIITVIIKLLFYPLTWKSFKSMQAMQHLQPQMKRLQDMYKNDRQKLNEEMMKLYREQKVNPLGGCLPMVVQIPVFISLYQVLYASIELRHAGFIWWIKDLSAPDYPMALLMGASMVVQQWMTPTTGDPRQAKMMLFMPIIFTFMFLNFPVGLVIYWLVNNLLTIAQQYVMLRNRPVATQSVWWGGITVADDAEELDRCRRRRMTRLPPSRRPLAQEAWASFASAGRHAVAIVRSMFRDRHGRPVERLPSHRVRFGNIIHPRTGATLDEVLVTYMRGPHSYTREDVVEISGHGGIGVMARILEALVASGARLAEPGEFTKRAFLNGRLDLSQAEAVIDLIQAQTEESQRQALAQLQGGLSQAIGAMREELLEVLAYVEGAMEFPEEDLDLLPWETLRAKAHAVEARMATLLDTFQTGRVLREGVQVAIVGRPNVGKSSLFNALLAANRAIVTPIPGTTRDVLEEVANLRGYPFRLVDTAGMRPSS